MKLNMTAKERADAKEVEIRNALVRAETRRADRAFYKSRTGLASKVTGRVRDLIPEDEEFSEQWSAWRGVNLAAAGRRITANH
jgi:hypothetical protein